jgi:hypothetical protein
MTTQGSGTDLPFSQSASPEEKARILLEQDRGATRASYNNVVAPAAGGRFARELPERTVGEAPFVDYPRLPAGSPWSQLQPPPEEPTGYEIDLVPAVGEQFEIDRAAEVAAGLVSPPPDSAQAGPLSPPAPADPSGFTEGSAPGLTLAPGPVTAAPSAHAAVASVAADANRAEHGRGGAVFHSRGSMTRRFG